MSLDQLRTLRRAGRRPAMVSLVIGKPPGWFDDGPSYAVVRDARNADLSPLLEMPVHVFDLTGNADELERVMQGLGAVQAKVMGVCGSIGACGVSEEHERVMVRYRERLCRI